jgi:2-oxoisovalerate dehydrogenase E2 component (dihydrolipoyl transacylase)
MPDFLLPDLGEGLTEAEIIVWRVEVGDHVHVDQPVVEVETAKAAVEVPVPFAGAVAKIHAAAGTVVAVGQPLISITADEPEPGLHEPGAVTPEPAAGSGETSGNVLIGYGTRARSRDGSRAARRARRAARPVPVAATTSPPALTSSAAPASSPASAISPAPASPAAPNSSPARGRPGPVAVISPLVRKIARDAGLDLASVAGTGPSGLVRREDVRKALTQPGTAKPAAVTAAPSDSGETRIPLRGARRAAAEKLSRSRREIPEATVWVDVDATGLLEARSALNANAAQQPVSLLALVARFALLGLRRYPELGARIDGDEIVVPGHAHLGFAAQTEHGLLVPVIHDAHLLTTRELSVALSARTAAARDGSLTPADLTGGTFTVNNYGVFGVDGSAAIINHPEVAILGLGRIIDRPWVVGGQVLVRKMGELTLAFDHRVCDGGTAGGFLRYVADCVESPVGALGDL